MRIEIFWRRKTGDSIFLGYVFRFRSQENSFLASRLHYELESGFLWFHVLISKPEIIIHGFEMQSCDRETAL